MKRIKNLSFGLHKHGGRSKGIICAPRRGTLIKRIYRFLDTNRTIFAGLDAKILIKYIYDPNRTGRITLIIYNNSILSYILAPKYNLYQKTISNLTENTKNMGWSNYLKLIPLGTVIFNIELIPGLGAKLVKAAGTSAILLRNDAKFLNRVLIKLKSGEHRLVSNKSVACVGIVSNNQYFLRDYKKAGTMRLYGKRPRVRPSAMNPVDHPMAGRTKGGCAPQSRTGILSLGTARVRNKSHKLIITSARKARMSKKKNQRNF